jgi:hypothetical protein
LVEQLPVIYVRRRGVLHRGVGWRERCVLLRDALLAAICRRAPVQREKWLRKALRGTRMRLCSFRALPARLCYPRDWLRHHLRRYIFLRRCG